MSKRELRQEFNPSLRPSPEHPVNGVSWYEAAAYCNWLSEQERIPQAEWCYVPNDKGEYAEGMKVKPNYLSLRGYRLPTEAEWAYACRARALTARHYGETEDLLGRYASTNSLARGTLAVGSLKPNDLGLFCPFSATPSPISGNRRLSA